MDVGTVLGLVAIGVAIAVPFGIEALKRPRLEIIPSQWSPSRFVTWTFATVRVYNKPLAKPLNRLVTRQAAQGCVIEIDYYLLDSEARSFPTVPGRWSSVPEPLRSVPSSLATERRAGCGGTTSAFTGFPVTGVGPPVTGGTAPIFAVPSVSAPVASTGAGFAEPKFTVVYDPTLDPGQRDVAVSQAGEEVAVAILRDGEAFAFSTESYNHPSWGNPAWRLTRGSTYRIVVCVRGSSIQEERKFRLEYLSHDISQFRLQEID